MRLGQPTNPYFGNEPLAAWRETTRKALRRCSIRRVPAGQLSTPNGSISMPLGIQTLSKNVALDDSLRYSS